MGTQDYSIQIPFSILNAENFIKSISENYMYVFAGKSKAWDDEQNPPMPSNTQAEFIKNWKDMLAVKRIYISDSTQAVVKNQWTTGTIYTPWDDSDTLLQEKAFFIVTSENNVYKCLDNGVGTPSTIEPSDTGITPFVTVDGYTWKFMYNLSTSDISKWNDPLAIPVKYLESNDGSLQWQVQSTAVAGTINRIEVLDKGTGYATAPIVTINGDGIGATATAILAGDKISYIQITNMGSGYTYATATVSGNAQLRVIIAPLGGHGSNPVKELFGNQVIIGVQFQQDEGGEFPTNLTFREIGLLINPYLYDSATLADLSGCYHQTTTLNLSGASGVFYQGEIINDTISNATAEVVSYVSNVLILNNVVGSFNDGDNIVGASSGVSANIVTTVEPTFTKNSGQIIYIENRPMIQRLETQIEKYKLVIRF